MLTIRRAPGERLVARGRSRNPDVLAHGEPDEHAVDLDHAAAAAALEVAVLVEDAVVRQPAFAVDGPHLAVAEDGRGVVDVLGALREADDRDDALRVGRQPVERRARVREDVLLQQQVLRRVAGQNELGEQHDLGPGLARLEQASANELLVPGDVADEGVDLRQRDPHACPEYARAARRACSGPVRGCWRPRPGCGPCGRRPARAYATDDARSRRRAPGRTALPRGPR